MMQTTGFLKRIAMAMARGFGAVFFVFAISNVSVAANATDDAEPDWTTAGIAGRAETIVYARHQSTEMRDTPHGVWTFYEFEVIDQIKGRRTSRPLVLALFGGKVGNKGSGVSDGSPKPEFLPAEEVVLFMKGKSAQYLPGLCTSSIFHIRPDAHGGRIVAPRPTGMTLYRANDGQPHPRMPDRVSLEDFLFSLGKHVAKAGAGASN